MRLNLPDVQATEQLGAALATVRPAQGMVYLQGDLGAGKSTLARALLRALGVQGAIRSPTYTLIERYPLPDGSEAWHLDLYRIGDVGELDFLGLDEAAATLWLVEWPERGRTALPPADLEIRLALADAGRRTDLVAHSRVGNAWLTELSQYPTLRAFSRVD